MIVHWTVIYYCIKMINYFTVSRIVTIENRFPKYYKKSSYWNWNIIKYEIYIISYCLANQNDTTVLFLITSTKSNIFMTSNLNIYSHIFSEDVKNVTVLHLSQFLFHDLQRDIQIVVMKIMSFISFFNCSQGNVFLCWSFF